MLNLFRRATAAPDVEQRDSLIPARPAYGSLSGQAVTATSAERHSVVFGCADFNAGLISSLPVDIYRKRSDGLSQPVDTAPAWLNEPEPGVDLISWLYAVMFSLEMAGNAFGIKTYDNRAQVTSVTLLDPGSVSAKRLRDGSVDWRINGKPIDPDALWHARSRAKAGEILGMSTLSIARESLGVGQATRDYIAQWFAETAHPSQHITYTMPEGQALSDEQAQTIKDRYLAAVTSRAPLVTSDRYSIDQIQVSPADSAFLEVVNATGADICRFMATDPAVVSVPVEGGSITYSNREQDAIDNLVYRVGPRLRRLEAALSTLTPRGQFVKLNTGALLQTDTLTRYKTHQLGIATGMYSPNERRRLEDDQARPDGDVWVDPRKTTSKPTDDGEDSDDES